MTGDESEVKQESHDDESERVASLRIWISKVMNADANEMPL